MGSVTLRVPGHVHWRRFDSEVVVLDLNGGEYYGLSEIAAAAFEGLARGQSTVDVVRDLQAVYDVDRGLLQQDIEKLVDDLVMRGLLVREEQTNEPSLGV
jgi:hypothetical protein